MSEGPNRLSQDRQLGGVDPLGIRRMESGMGAAENVNGSGAFVRRTDDDICEKKIQHTLKLEMAYADTVENHTCDFFKKI